MNPLLERLCVVVGDNLNGANPDWPLILVRAMLKELSKERILQTEILKFLVKECDRELEMAKDYD